MIRTTNITRSAPKSMLGMSLVEILTAMLIGLIGMTIIMQVFSVSESRKRTTTGTSDAQITGNIAMFTLEHELRNAGYGMVSASNNMLGCTTIAYDSTRTTADFNFTMAPVVITDGAAGAPDEVTLIFGNAPQTVDGAGFASGATSDADFPLANAAGFRVGALAVASDPAAGVNCAMVEVTGFAVGAVNNVQHGNGASYTYTNNYGFPVTVTATRNKPGGVTVGGAFPTGTQLFSLGRSPTIKTYVIEDDKLQTKTLVPYNAAQDPDGDDLSDAEVADGIVQLQAQYGKDTDADRIVDRWDQCMPTDCTKPLTDATVADWQEVQAVRFAILVRSQQFERSVVTNAAPTWYGGAFAMTDPDAATSWQNYRYRVYQIIVPLRNMIWSTDP